MGLSLPEGEKRDRFKAIKERMTEIVTQFQKTLNEEDGALWLTPEELDGLPDDILERLENGAGENEGKKKLTFKYPDVIPAAKFVKDGAVRRKISLADTNKCNSNAPLFKELVVLRDEAARILGYPNHATMRLDERMAKDPTTVKTFLEDLRDRLKPAGKEQVAQLYEIKKADLKERGLPEEPDFYTWDWRYYERILVEKEYKIEENKIAEYFSLNSTVTGMLGIFEKLFGLRFFELSEDDKAALSPTGKASDVTWHKDVVMFSVFDDEANGDGFIGYFYMDMHPRPGKYTHAANFGIQPGWTQKDGTRHYPCTALVCNFSPPTDKKPSLLKHDEVTTLFHELGHGIHDLVGKTRYARFHGTNTARDFVEAPSQMLENWCWTPGVLKTLSKHWSTGESIPDDLVGNLVRTYRLHEALLTLRQLQFGFYDMAVHTPESHEAAKALETGPLYNEMRASLVPMKGEEAFGKGFDFSHGEATFGHLVGGYDSGYYGYLYSQVYSADMWHAAFKSDPMNGEMGRKYRAIVLQRGGSRDEMENLEEFLGRKPNSEAFYRELGITK
jgi:metallopeptidase MepB